MKIWSVKNSLLSYPVLVSAKYAYYFGLHSFLSEQDYEFAMQEMERNDTNFWVANFNFVLHEPEKDCRYVTYYRPGLLGVKYYYTIKKHLNELQSFLEYQLKNGSTIVEIEGY